MARSEAAHLSNENEAATPDDLAVAIISAARQNVIAARSTVPGDNTVLLYSNALADACSQTAGNRIRSSWGAG